MSKCLVMDRFSRRKDERTIGRANVNTNINTKEEKKKSRNHCPPAFDVDWFFSPVCALTHSGFYVSESTKIKTWYWTIHVKISNRESWIDTYAQLEVHY